MEITAEEKRGILNRWFVDTRINNPEKLDSVYELIYIIDHKGLNIPTEIIDKYKN